MDERPTHDDGTDELAAQLRRYADACEHFFAQRMPVTHAAFVAAGRVAP